MTGAVYARTTNLGLGLLEFSFPNWGDDANENSKLIDVAVGMAGVQISGIWHNETFYNVGQLVADGATDELFRCRITHTSGSAPATFAEDRLLNPTYWESMATILHARGQWQPTTTYYLNDVVYKNSDKYSWALGTTQFVSSSSYDDDVAAGKFVIITDTTSTVSAATGAATSASASATAAAGSASAAATSATTASNQAANALTFANASANNAAVAVSARDVAISSANTSTAASTSSMNSANAANASAIAAAASASAAAASAATFLPEAPSDGQTYGRKNGVWAPLTGAVITIGTDPPSSPSVGQLWWESDKGDLFIWYNDGDSQQWVSANAGVQPIPTAGGGISEAPIDGNAYERKNADWVLATGGGGGGSGVTDGDKGDIVVSGTGATWLFDSAVVTAAAKTVLDDTTVGAMLTTLGAAPTVHTHAQTDVTGLVAALAAKEPTITGGTTAQYWRGDKSWQTLDKTAVGLANVANTAQVTSVTGTAPVVSSGGTTPAISMAAATSSVNGYLTSTDWTTFNNKLNASSYTAADVLSKMLTVDGAGSGLDAELVGGKKITVASSAPSSPATNDVWIDTT